MADRPRLFDDVGPNSVPAALVLQTLNLTQDALVSVAAYMIADWGKTDEAAKSKAIDEIIFKLKEFTNLQQRILDITKNTGGAV